MIQLEHIQDDMNEHDIHYTSEHHPEELTEDQIAEYEEEMRRALDDVRTELRSLEDQLGDDLRELRDRLPRCRDCEEVLDDDTRSEIDEGLCEDCYEEDDLDEV